MQEQMLRKRRAPGTGPTQACAGERASVHCPWLLPPFPTETPGPARHALGSLGSLGSLVSSLPCQVLTVPFVSLSL